MSTTVNDTRANRLAALSILSNDERIYIQGDLQSIDLTASRLSNVSHTLQAFKRVIESLLKSEDVNDARVISALDNMSAAEEEERRHWPDDERVTFEDLIDAYRSNYNARLTHPSFSGDRSSGDRSPLKMKKRRTESSTQRASLKSVILAGLAVSAYFLSQS